VDGFFVWHETAPATRSSSTSPPTKSPTLIQPYGCFPKSAPTSRPATPILNAPTSAAQSCVQNFCPDYITQADFQNKLCAWSAADGLCVRALCYFTSEAECPQSSNNGACRWVNETNPETQLTFAVCKSKTSLQLFAAAENGGKSASGCQDIEKDMGGLIAVILAAALGWMYYRQRNNPLPNNKAEFEEPHFAQKHCPSQKSIVAFAKPIFRNTFSISFKKS
jgi:hypothetical protein